MDADPRYPWHRLEDKEAFFVPALDVDLVMQEGMRASLPYTSDTRRAPNYAIGVFKGKLGVLFFREGLASRGL